MKKYALAYAMNEGLPLFTKEDLQCLTHINLAFGLVKDGLLDMSQLTNLSLIETFRAWKPEIRIVLSVGNTPAAARRVLTGTPGTERILPCCFRRCGISLAPAACPLPQGPGNILCGTRKWKRWPAW